MLNEKNIAKAIETLDSFDAKDPSFFEVIDVIFWQTEYKFWNANVAGEIDQWINKERWNKDK